MKLFGRLFLTIVLLTGLSVQAQTVRCESVFVSTLSDSLQSIEIESDYPLYQGSPEEFAKDLPLWRKWALQRALSKVDLKKIKSEKAVEKLAVKLSAISFGDRHSLWRWMRESSEQRLKSSTDLIIKENLLRKGLLNAWSEVHDPSEVSFYQKAMSKARELHLNRVIDILRFPFILPNVKDSKISDDLMFAIIRDGFDAHASEIQRQIGGQSLRETYMTFKKVYSAIFFVAIFAVQYSTTMDQVHQQADQLYNNFVGQLEKVRSSLDPVAIKSQVVEEAYQKSEKAFIAKWGERPTSAEETLMRARIRQELSS